MEAKIKSTKSALPENISRATTLVIDEPSSAGDVFHILTGYPKIKKVRVAGIDYKREQIGKLTFADRLGNSSAAATYEEQLVRIFSVGAGLPGAAVPTPQAPPAPIQPPTIGDYMTRYEQAAQDAVQEQQQRETVRERAARQAQALRTYTWIGSTDIGETPF